MKKNQIMALSLAGTGGGLTMIYVFDLLFGVDQFPAAFFIVVGMIVVLLMLLVILFRVTRGWDVGNTIALLIMSIGVGVGAAGVVPQDFWWIAMAVAFAAAAGAFFYVPKESDASSEGDEYFPGV